MPHTTYSRDEVSTILRLAYATGVRDALITLQGHPLTDEQVALLAPFVTDSRRLRGAVDAILSAAGAITMEEWMKHPLRAVMDYPVR